MAYPLLFPRGDFGYTLDMKPEISPAAYYSYRLMKRGEDCLLFRGGRLLQQYLVDMYAKIEADRVNFIRYNQNQLRAEVYSKVVDSMYSGESDAANIGQRVILPSTFQGSPRNMMQRYQDAMTIVRNIGNPDYFVTMTTNPDWVEIKRELRPGQTASDRPDIVVRVFKLKLAALMEDLKTCFGKLAGIIYVVEFQKRGLPHAHILMIMEPEHKPRTPEDVDRYVHAEIPNPDDEPDLYQVVTKHNLHGRCGADRLNAPCMADGKCKRNFPKEFASTTKIGNDSYPTYQRRNNGVQCTKRGLVYDNKWVVPYSPYLSRKYDCHINVEVTSGIKAVKYLYKYTYKGGDMATVATGNSNENDEIQHFIDSRYVSSMEACWRIFRFDLFSTSHSITRLSIHLEGQQLATFHQNDDLRDVVLDVKDTTLTGWLKYNSENQDLRVNKL